MKRKTYDTFAQGTMEKADTPTATVIEQTTFTTTQDKINITDGCFFLGPFRDRSGILTAWKPQ